MPTDQHTLQKFPLPLPYFHDLGLQTALADFHIVVLLVAGNPAAGNPVGGNFVGGSHAAGIVAADHSIHPEEGHSLVDDGPVGIRVVETGRHLVGSHRLDMVSLDCKGRRGQVLERRGQRSCTEEEHLLAHHTFAA